MFSLEVSQNGFVHITKSGDLANLIVYVMKLERVNSGLKARLKFTS